MPPAPPRPGIVLGIGNGYRWVAYELWSDEICAALYLDGRLLRRDYEGWWVCDYLGKRIPVTGDVIARYKGTGPTDQFRPHPEQDDLE